MVTQSRTQTHPSQAAILYWEVRGRSGYESIYNYKSHIIPANPVLHHAHSV